MGVKYLISFLRRFTPKSIRKVDKKELRYKTLAIDGTLLIRRMFSSPWVPIPDRYRHILWTLYLARICRLYKVIPIIVFDGQRSAPEKSDEQIRRTNIKEEIRKNFVKNTNKAARLKSLMEIAYQMSKLNIQDREIIDLLLKKAIYVYNNFKSEMTGFDSYESDLAIKLQIWIRNEFSIYKNGNTILESLLELIIDYIYKISLDSTAELTSELSTLINLLDPNITNIVRDDLEKQQISMDILIEKLSRRLSVPTWKQINQTKTIFKTLGMTVLTSPPGYEAEAVASSLVNNGIADFVVTEDTDTLLFNAKMLRGFMSMKKLVSGRNNFFLFSNMYMIDPIDVRLNLGNISENSFIDFAILCGTDFCKTIKGLGSLGAFFLIQKYKNIELILENLSKFKTKDGRQKYVAPENYIQEVQIARKVFMRVPHMHFFDHKLIISNASLFNIRENDWKELEKSIIDKYKLKQLNLSFFSTF